MKSGNFSVQVVRKGEGLIILAERVEGGENYVIELGEDQVPAILNEFGGDFPKLTEFLEVMNKRLVLLNPRAQKKGRKKRRRRRGRRARSNARETHPDELEELEDEEEEGEPEEPIVSEPEAAQEGERSPE